MKINNINKNLVIYNIKTLNVLNDLVIIISLNLGWLIFPVKKINNIKLEPIIFGYNRLYKFFFKLKGFGFK